MEIGVCRRIEGQSCPYEGGEVPTLVDLVPQLGSSIAQTVIVEVGSNDPQDVFAQEVEDAMHVLLHYGVTRVLWMNFHEVQGQYPAMNQALVSAAQTELNEKGGGSRSTTRQVVVVVLLAASGRGRRR